MEEFVAKELPGQKFESRDDMFAAIKRNKGKLIELKRAEDRKSDPFFFGIETETSTTKAVAGLKEGNIYPVINTTKIMDSHNDVHLDGIWNKTLSDQQGKIFYVTDHDMKINSVIAYPKDVRAFVQTVAWTDLGKSFEGNTQALMFEVPEEKVKHSGAKEIIEQKIDIEHSVRMQYVKLELAIDRDICRAPAGALQISIQSLPQKRPNGMLT